MTVQRVLVIGGGVCGLGVAWKLAKAGVDVTIFERGEPIHEATWYSGGMLAPNMELRPREESITLLGVECLRRWRRFAEELEADAGLSIDYRDEGTLFVGLDRDAVEQLRFVYRHQQDVGLSTRWMSGAEAREREPSLSHRVAAAIFAESDHQVDARAFGRALVRALEAAGGTIRSGAAVESVLVESGRAVGVRLPDDDVRGDAVVVAAGTWSGMIDGLDTARPPVRPVKGQMALLRQPSPPLVEHVIWAATARDFAYMAPKGNGTLFLGATVEEKGFDTDVTAGGLLSLLRPAWEALPSIDDLPILETGVGLRPASRDNAPILGATPIDGLFMATGQYRNGILFAPVTAEDVARLILTGETSEAIRPFRVDRFLR